MDFVAENLFEVIIGSGNRCPSRLNDCYDLQAIGIKVAARWGNLGLALAFAAWQQLRQERIIAREKAGFQPYHPLCPPLWFAHIFATPVADYSLRSHMCKAKNGTLQVLTKHVQGKE